MFLNTKNIFILGYGQLTLLWFKVLYDTVGESTHSEFRLTWFIIEIFRSRSCVACGESYIFSEYASTKIKKMKKKKIVIVPMS